MPFADSTLARIYYETHGPSEGPAVVFAHGAGGNTLSWWQQVPHFAARQRVVTLDHRGFGRSTCAPDDFHPKHFPTDLLSVLDAEGISSAVLVCQSLGGWTGLRTAVSNPERVDGLVLCDTPGGLWLPVVVEALAGVSARAGSEGIRGHAALAPDYPERRPEMAFLYDQISAHNERFEPAMLARMVDEEGRTLPEALAGYAVPTLMLVGECDQLFPAAMLHAVAEAIPGCRVHDFPGVGHSTYFEDPDTFNRVVEGFVARVVRRGGRSPSGERSLRDPGA